MKESKFLQLIEKQLSDEPFSKDGTLQKWVVIGKAQNGDQELLKCLLASAELKTAFFKPIDTADGALVFEHQKFIRYLEMKNFLKDSYTEYQNKIGLHTDGQYLKPSGDVVLAWPFKDCVLEGGQAREDDKRNEVFFNQTLAHDEITQLLSPKVLTAAVRYTAKGKSAKVQFNRDSEINKKRDLPADTITDNIIIKGNNLLALHSLEKQFSGRVKLIYIDPPYNTGGDANIFTYNNNFNHSTWLTFMKNRLEVARELLREDGFIAIAIDDYEQAYLRVICDEIFDKTNFVGTVAIRHFPGGRTNNRMFATTHEYCHYYAKDIRKVKLNDMQLSTEEIDEKFNKSDENGKYRLSPFARMGEGLSTPEERPNLFYPIYYHESKNEFSLDETAETVKIIPMDSTGKKRVWRNSKSTFLELIKANEVVCIERNGKFSIFKKRREKSGIKPQTIWYDGKYSAASYGTALLKKYLGGEHKFSFPKSLHTVKDTISITTNKNDIVLDFFTGSGTTGHAVLALNKEDGGNRQFILVEQLDNHVAVCQQRLTAVMKSEKIQGSFVYLELQKHNQKFVEAIQTATTSKMLLNIWEKMKKESFLNCNLDLKKQEESLAEFKKLTLKQQKESLLEILDKNQMYVNLPSLHDTDQRCSSDEKRITADFYGIKK